MKHLNLLFIFLLQAGISFSQTPGFEWVHTHGGANLDLAITTATDSQNNVYTAGYFTGTVDFDPGPGVTNLSGGVRAVFIQKLNPAGDLVWAKTFQGIAAFTSMAIDPSDNIIIGGYFYVSVSIPVLTGTGNFSSPDEQDALLIKMNPGGDFIWAKSFGNAAAEDNINGVYTDDLGNVYSIGHFGGLCDFDPGAGTANLNSENNSQDIFVQKLSPTGDYIWAEKVGGTGFDEGNSIAVHGNTILLTGWFVGNVDFDPSSGTHIVPSNSANNNTDIYLLSLTTDGTFNWVKSFTGNRGQKVLMNHNSDIYLTGIFNNESMDLDPGPATHIVNAVNSDFFIVKLTAAGDFSWGRTFEGNNRKFATSMTIHPNNGVVTVGEFKGTVDFNCGPGVNNLTAINAEDLFIIYLDSDGNHVWSGAFGNTGDLKDVARDVSVDNLGNIYTVGGFMETVDFNCGPGVTARTTSGDGDMFIQKLNSNLLSVNDKILNEFNLYPNPSGETVFISTEQFYNGSISIYNALGAKVLESQFSGTEIQLNIQSLSPGSYTIELGDDSESARKMLVKME